MTVDKLKEKFLSILLAIIIFVSDLSLRWSSKLDMERLVDKTVDYSSIGFGFLLTVLAILLQSQTKALLAIKNAGRFNDLINANKKGVIASLILVFISIVYLALTRADLFNLILYKEFSIKQLTDSAFLSILVYQLVEVVLFLEIFYIAIKD